MGANIFRLLWKIERAIAIVIIILLFLSPVLIVVPSLSHPQKVFAATSVNLGTADTFAVLGGSTVTNTGSSVVTGDLGLTPGTSVTGFPPGTVTGTLHVTDSVALQAQNDLTTAYNNAAGQPCTSDLTGQDLGGMTLTPGVYCFSTIAQLTGTLTLDGQNQADSVFIFQIGSSLTTAGSSVVSLINSAQSCHVFWQIGASATLGTSSIFKGTLLALTSITLTTSASVDGRALARNGAVTLDTNNVTKPTCLQCFINSDCNDADSCTTDTCSSNVCSNTNTPVDGSWSYSTWGECSGSCGGGSGTQTRTTLSCSATCSGTCGTATTSQSCTNNSACPTTTTSSDSTSTTTSSTSSTSSSCPPIDTEVVPPIITSSKRIDADSIYLNWGPFSGTDKFIVKYGTSKDNLIYNVNVAGFETTLNNLPTNAPIWVQVAARNECQIGSFGELKLVGGSIVTSSPGFPDTGNPRLPETGYGPKQ